MKFLEWINKKFKKTYVYHVSPKSSIVRLRPTSARKGLQAIKQGTSGIYVAPKFRDAVAWATSFVGHKKYNTQKPNERLKEKGGGYHGDKFPETYNNLTIYKIEVPEDLLKIVWKSSSWEPEYFIPAEYMDNLKIIKSKTYSMNDLILMDNKRSQKRTELASSSLLTIKKASKSNLAARYYLELTDFYNQYLLKGKKPILNDDPKYSNDHLIRQKIDKLKDYIYENDNYWTYKIREKLNKAQQLEVEKLYLEIKKLIENL